MPGPLPKAPDRLQRRNVKARAEVGGPRIVRVPAAPDGLLPETVVAWEAYWTSAVAAALDMESDAQIVVRLFHLYDDHERARLSYVNQPLVMGSQGQPVLNPLGRVRSDMEKEIRQLEDRLGMNPKARVALGLHITEAGKSLKKLMESVNPYADDDANIEAI